MKTKTLKDLIRNAAERAGTKEDLLTEVIRLIKLFEEDREEPISQAPAMQKFADYQPIGDGKVPYFTICSCNPANGGSGICGCVIGNKMVDPVTPSHRTLFETGGKTPPAKTYIVADWPNTDSTTVG